MSKSRKELPVKRGGNRGKNEIFSGLMRKKESEIGADLTGKREELGERLLQNKYW